MGEVKKRKPLTAALLSLAMPGLGQLYNGQILKAVIFYLAAYLLLLAAGLSSLLYSFKGMASFVVISIVIFIVIIADAAIQAGKIKDYELKPYNRAYIYILIIILTLVSQELISGKGMIPVKTYRIPSSSMEPAILKSDRLVAIRDYFKKVEPKRDEMIIFTLPCEPETSLVKRVAGLPGDVIEIRNKAVYINGKHYRTKHEQHSDPNIVTGGPAVARDNMPPTKILPGNYFVLGDNRDVSYDSRFWGQLPADRIFDKPIYLYWSKKSSRIGKVIE
jgi:signal peptidase I